MKNLVDRYIEDTFNLSGFTVEDVPLFPDGKKIIDQNGESLLIFNDIMYDRCVCVSLVSEKDLPKERYKYVEDPTEEKGYYWRPLTVE